MPDTDHHNPEQQHTDRQLYHLRIKAALVLCFENLWPLLLPVILVTALLCSLLWLGLFQIMPRWLHLTIGGLFVLGFVAALTRLRHFRLPDDHAVNNRLEHENGLLHRPLQLATDRLSGDRSDPLAQLLWQEHRKRMAAQTANLHGFLPAPQTPKSAYSLVRSFIVLLFVTTAAYSVSPIAGRLDNFWMPPAGHSGPPTRIDAWITPPAYTGKAPIYLSTATIADAKPVTVPQGSLFSVQISGTSRNQLSLTGADGQSRAIEAKATAENSKAPNSTAYEVPIQQSGMIELKAGSTRQNWQLNVLPDNPPLVEFTKDPTYALNGTLELHYNISDDYGITNLQGDITLLEQPDNAGRSLTEAPELKLSNPRRKTDKPVETTSLQDLTMHPWAGKYVALQLHATDEAGQTGSSKTIRFVLPQRPFTNPLARAIVEQRQILALDSSQQRAVIQMLDALTMHPQTTIPNLSHFLGVRSIRERLNLAQNDEALRPIIDYMWNVARGIEDGQLSDAEKALRAAQEALSEALQNNAGPEEIARLTEKLREAMNRYLAEMARRQQNNPNQSAQANPNTKVLSQRDIDRMMQQIEDLARSGNHAEAQQLLSQLQEMLNNLQPSQSAQGNGKSGQQGPNSSQQQLNQLGDLMRRQQQLMNDTFKLDQQLQEQLYNGYDGDGEQQADPQQQQSRQKTEQDLKDLQQQQQDLQQELNALTDKLKQQGLESSKEMDQALNSMGRAGRSLGNGESGRATDQQGEALDALRRGAREMMQQMQKAQGEGQNGEQSGQSGEGRDPLGRETGQNGSSDGTGTQLPNQIDIQKARKILDEIRRKLGNALSPQQEKDYLERLLKTD